MVSTAKELLNSVNVIICDMNGVLKNDEPDHYMAFLEVVKKHDADFPYEVYLETCAGLSDEEGALNLIKKFGITLSTQELVEQKQEKYYERIQDSPPNELPGSIELLTLLINAGKKCYVVSSSTLEEAEPFIIKAGFEKIFPKLHRYLVVEKAKRQSVYEEIVKINNLTPDKCVLLDDSPRNIEWAHELGIKTIGFANTRPVSEFEADLVVEDAQDLLYQFEE